MTAGYKSAAVDFDDLFDPDIVGDGPTAPGYAVAGTALRYAALSYGTKRANVGYSIGGVDVSNLWAAKGTATYAVTLGFEGQEYLASRESPATTTVTLTIKTDGNWSVTRNVGVPNPMGSGVWDSFTGAPSEFEVMFIPTVMMDNGMTYTNGAATYQPLTANRAIAATASGSDLSGILRVRCLIRRISTGAPVVDSYCDLYPVTLSG